MSHSHSRHGIDDFGDADVLEKLLDIPNQRVIQPARQTRVWYWFWPWVTHGLLLLCSVVSFVLWARTWSMLSLVDPLASYSPVDVAVEYLDNVKFNGSLYSSSIYRGPPGPKVDAAWRHISFGVRPTRASLDQLKKMGKVVTPSTVKYHEEDGGGFLVYMEGWHQLHCLDVLRQSIDRDYYNSTTLFKTTNMRIHTDHCVEFLRQGLMCNADINLVTFQWIEGFGEPYPDYNTVHQCKNFDKILRWSYDNEINARVRRLGDEVDLAETPV